MSRKLWEPSAERIAQTHLKRFTNQLETKYGISLDSYRALHQWSIQHKAEFWSEVWEYSDIQASRTWDAVIAEADKMPGARWFPGAQLNFAENLLKDRSDRQAIIFHREDGAKRTLSFNQLYLEVAQLASALRQKGVTVGDRVAGFLPNCPETVIAMLATVSIGAIWSSCSPDFGANGVLERFEQIKPKVIFAIDGYHYGGKTFNSLPLVETLVSAIPSIESTIILPYLSSTPNTAGISSAVIYQDCLDKEACSIQFEQLPFEHPLYVLYSSGTTGKPKCIVHSAGGTLIQHLKEHQLHIDLKDNDKMLYYTTCGWMMWNWLVTALASGACIVLVDGSPFYPEPTFLWDIVDEDSVTIFGVSAKYIAAIEKADVKPAESHELSQLKCMLSTGSTLLPESFDYVYRDIKEDIQLSSISGGTDIVSCFALGNPVLPVYQGEIQCAGLGMDVQVFNDEGQSIEEEQGELVCCSPFPSMPIYFWNDEDGQRYHQAYFDRFDDIWAHGDYALLAKHDQSHSGVVIYGRSDAILNPGGVRIGTAEIYRQVETIPEVLESLAVGQQWQDDERIILFVKLRDESTCDDDLVQTIKTTIRKNATPRHVPAKVIQVPDIPKTLSGKIVELAVKKLIHGQSINNVEALANPECLAFFENIEELQT